MPAPAGRTVFISHAINDPDWPETAVEALAAKLRQRGATVLLDLWHERDVVQHKLPMGEWRRWMRQCLDDADHVLCLCSDKYAKLSHRDDKHEPGGRGIAYESFEIEKRLYGQKQHNEDWIWILRLDDASSTKVVPHFMQERCIEYGTPSEENRLVGDLAGRRSGAGVDQQAAPRIDTPCQAPEPGTGSKGDPDPLKDQRTLALDRLKQSPGLWDVLRNDNWEDRRPAVLTDQAAFVGWLSRASAGEAEDAMFAVRRALHGISGTEDVRRLAELAAVALYCLAVCRLVDASALCAPYRFPAAVGGAAQLYCAVIATVLFGGRLELVPSNDAQRPRAPNAYEIRVPAAGDHAAQAFERAVYQALFADLPEAVEVSLDGGELTADQRAEIRRRIATVRRRQLHTLTLVVNTDSLCTPADMFAQQYAVPVFVCDAQIAGALMGMSVQELVADIKEMWGELHICNRHPLTS